MPVGGAARQISEQRALADAGLSTYDGYLTLTAKSVLEQTVERVTFGLTS
jgi:hypothetical protein